MTAPHTSRWMIAAMLAAGCGGGGNGNPDAAIHPDAGPDAANLPVIIADTTITSGGPDLVVCQHDPTPGGRGTDGLRINARLTGTSTGFSDVYDCTTVALVTPPLTTGAGSYDVWVDYINDRGFPADPSKWVVVGTTTPLTVDVTTDLHVPIDLIVSSGFFEANWSLTDAAGNPITQCTDVPGEASVSVLGTLLGPDEIHEDLFDCEAGFNNPQPVRTGPDPLGDYVFSLSILDANGAALGQSAAINGSLLNGNDYTGLGIVDIVVN